MSFFKNLFSSKKEDLSQTKILLEEKSPSCPITAIVEQDSRVVHFYLWSAEVPRFGTKSCWVRNLKEAPEERETNLAGKGLAPMLLKANCKYPSGQAPLVKEDLKIIWFEEGNGAALLENGNTLAIIPCWSGYGGFYGYARDCVGQGEFAWEFSEENIMHTRIQNASQFWDSWSIDPNPFSKMQPEILQIYDDLFGKGDKYFAIAGDKWHPKGLYLRKGEFKYVFATVGMSLRPQPMVEMQSKNAKELDRIELGLILNAKFPESGLQKVAEWISGQANIPWSNITWLGEGHTINFDVFGTKKFSAVILTDKLDILPKVNLPVYRESKLKILWMIPITVAERNHVMNNGSGKLIQELNAIGEDIYSLDRDELKL